MINVNMNLSQNQDLFTLTISAKRPLTHVEIDAILKNISTQLLGGSDERTGTESNAGFPEDNSSGAV